MRPDKVNKYLKRRMQPRELLGHHGEGSQDNNSIPEKILPNDSKPREFGSQSSCSENPNEEEAVTNLVLRNFIMEKITKKEEVGSQYEQNETSKSFVSYFKPKSQRCNKNQSQTLFCAKFQNRIPDASVIQPKAPLDQETAITNIEHQISYDIQKWNATTNTGRKKPDISRELARKHIITNRRDSAVSVIKFASRHHRGDSQFFLIHYWMI